MFLMSNSLALCEASIYFSQGRLSRVCPSYKLHSAVRITKKRRRFRVLVPNAKNDKSRKRTWWEKFFFDNDVNWFGLKEGLLEEIEGLSEEDGDKELPEGDRFEAWKRRVEAISELREAQEDMRTSESRDWEDWLVEVSSGVDSSSGGRDWEIGLENQEGEVPGDLSMSEKGFAGAIKDLVFRNDDDELLYEDRVFRYASSSTAKFLALLVLIPWTFDFVVHNYVLMPFLDRIELRDEWRLENRRAFANIWSDMVFGIVLFILIYFNQSKVALMKFTGYKILKNVSDSGKAFLIILITDIFLGYHSASGWQTLIEIILEHYGLEVDPAAVTIFISFVPVVIDACVKLWLFKFLPRLSPNVANIFREMKRH